MNDCGHTDAVYCVMACGDAYHDEMRDQDGGHKSGCYVEFYACLDCVENGQDWPSAQKWWLEHSCEHKAAGTTFSDGEYQKLKNRVSRLADDLKYTHPDIFERLLDLLKDSVTDP